MQRAISALAVATGARAIAGSERPNAKVKMAAAAPNRKLCGTRPLICDLTASAVRGNRNMFIDHVLAVGNAVVRRARERSLHARAGPSSSRRECRSDRHRASTCRLSRGPRAFLQAMAGAESRSIPAPARSEEHTSELQSLMRTSYAVFCL